MTEAAFSGRSQSQNEFAEMNLTDHAGVRLTHGKPKVNGVKIHYAIGGAGEPVFWNDAAARCRASLLSTFPLAMIDATITSPQSAHS